MIGTGSYQKQYVSMSKCVCMSSSVFSLLLLLEQFCFAACVMRFFVGVVVLNHSHNHPAAQNWLPHLSRVEPGQYLDGKPPGKTRLLLEEVLARAAVGAHPVVCVRPKSPVL